MVVKLSKVLRRLLRKHENFSALRDELSFIEDYLAIEVVRFGDKLRFERDVAEDTLDMLVPSMILQPLVENSIKHGLSSKVEGGTIRIRTRRGGSRLCLTVEDDGVGIPEAKLATLLDHGNRRQQRQRDGSRCCSRANTGCGSTAIRAGAPASRSRCRNCRPARPRPDRNHGTIGETLTRMEEAVNAWPVYGLPATLAERTRRVYDRLSAVYPVSSMLFHSRAHRCALEASGVRDGMEVLEVATGSGEMFRRLVRANAARFDHRRGSFAQHGGAHAARRAAQVPLGADALPGGGRAPYAVPQRSLRRGLLLLHAGAAVGRGHRAGRWASSGACCATAAI